MALSAGVDVVVVTGPPGSGKTTVSRALADAAKLSVHVESDWFFRFLRAGRIPPYLPDSRKQNDIVMDLTVDAVVAYANGGYLVFWDGIVGPWYLDRVTARIPAGIKFHYVVLRPPRDIALARVVERDGITELSGAEVMYRHFEQLGDYESHSVDTEGSVETLVRSLEADLHEGRFLLTTGT